MNLEEKIRNIAQGYVEEANIMTNSGSIDYCSYYREWVESYEKALGEVLPEAEDQICEEFDVDTCEDLYWKIKNDVDDHVEKNSDFFKDGVFDRETYYKDRKEAMENILDRFFG